VNIGVQGLREYILKMTTDRYQSFILKTAKHWYLASCPIQAMRSRGGVQELAERMPSSL